MVSLYTPTERIKILAPSATIALDAKAKKLMAEGQDIVNLTLGEPNFDTPSHIKKAAIAAMEKGFTHYTEVPGVAPLREAIAKKFATENNIQYSPSEIIVGVGSKQLLYTAFLTLLEKGEEVLVPVPTWVSYVEQIKLVEGKPVIIPLASPFKLTVRDLEKHVTKKTKVLLLNSPSNPTGAVIEPSELKKIASFVLKHHLWVISDEIYEKLIYGSAQHVSIASISDEIKQRTITINGVSKAYAMTGWRVGYAGAPQAVIDAMKNVQGQTVFHTASISQYAAIAALNGSQAEVKKMKKGFEKQRTAVVKLLKNIPQLSFPEPEGAFYVYFSIEKLLSKKVPTSAAWCELLLEQAGVALIPGEAFSYPGYVRLSYANSIEKLTKGISRIQSFIKGEAQ